MRLTEYKGLNSGFEIAIKAAVFFFKSKNKLTNHTYTFDNSFAPVCVLQTGAFCVFSKNFFKKFLKTNVHFEVRRFEGLRKGTFQIPPLSRQRKEVRT